MRNQVSFELSKSSNHVFYNDAFTLTLSNYFHIPLLMAQMERMGIHPLLDSCFSTHGNWKGLNHVQGWT